VYATTSDLAFHEIHPIPDDNAYTGSKPVSIHDIRNFGITSAVYLSGDPSFVYLSIHE